MSKLLTTGDIALNVGADRDKVTYAIRKLGIEPKQRAGILNLYTDDVIRLVRKFIKEHSEPERQEKGTEK